MDENYDFVNMLPDIYRDNNVINDTLYVYDKLTSETHKCPVCEIDLQRKDNMTCICVNCGYETLNEAAHDEYSIDVAQSYSTQNNTTMRVHSVTPMGKKLNNILMGATSGTHNQKGKRVLDKISKWLYQASDEIIPNAVASAAVESYIKIQTSDGVVKRGGKLNGILAALIYDECVKHGIPRKPRTIATIAGISETQLSEGRKELLKLSRTGTIILSEGGGEAYQFIQQYFERLGLQEYDHYKGFLLELINATSMEKIRMSSNTARTSTRCAGVLCILCTQLGIKKDNPITRDTISEVCEISKSTFIRFIAMVQAYKNEPEIVEIFERYEVPKL